MTNPLRGVRWLWVLLGGFLAEVALMIVAVPAYMTPSPDAVMSYAIPPAALIAPFLVALWIAGKTKSNHLLNGALVGVVAALLYTPAFFVRETMPPAFLLAEALKVVGGVAGGFVAARRKTATAPSAG